MKPGWLSLLGQLWLREPDPQAIAQARRILALAPHCDGEGNLAEAYVDLLLLNVYPYASVFIQPAGEMNGSRAQELRDLYQACRFAPEELYQVGAPDHLGLLLALLEQVSTEERTAIARHYGLDWAPVLCLAIERQPGVHPFYGSLAAFTRQALFEIAARPGLSLSRRGNPTSAGLSSELAPLEDEAENSLRDVVDWLFCPARSGIFLSRARLGLWGRELGLPLAFGERFQVGVSLFQAAGLAGQVENLVDRLSLEVNAWDAMYADWAREYPVWDEQAKAWRDRTAHTEQVLKEMRRQSRSLINGLDGSTQISVVM